MFSPGVFIKPKLSLVFIWNAMLSVKYLSSYFIHNNEDSICSLQCIQEKTLLSLYPKYIFLVKSFIVQNSRTVGLNLVPMNAENLFNILDSRQK